MNTKDLYNALQFLKEHTTLSLVVLTRQDIPYVKRLLLHQLGTPNKMIDNTLWYPPGIVINIFTVRNIPKGVRGTLFYIGYEDDDDKYMLENQVDIVHEPVRSIELWKSLRLDVSAMYRALLVDGYDSREAFSILYYTGVLEEV